MKKDYSEYHMTWKEYLLFGVCGVSLSIAAGYLFYQSFLAAVFLSPLAMYYIKNQRKHQAKKQKQQLMVQFQDAMISLASALEAGYSVENAFAVVVSDLLLIYPENAAIIQEMGSIQQQISMNIPIEQALENFAMRSGLEDIESFSEVFSSVKRSGGDFIRIIRSTSHTINEKTEVLREIETTLTATKLEVMIMKFIPFVILLYLSIFCPNLLAPLYHNGFGICFMTVMLGVWCMIAKLADHMMQIEI